MRHDARNTGRSVLPGNYRAGERPWAFRTGKGIFSTPVVGPDGTVYVGSADSFFYAIRRTGKLRWTFRTGNIIDSAAVLHGGTLTFGSGDETLYRLTTKRRIVWRFRPTHPPVKGQQVNWWEGNADVGPGGNVYAGNTGGYEYAVTPKGKEKWAFAAGNSVWTDPAFAADGTAYVGSVDRSVYALDTNGNKIWSTPTLGFVVSSPALGSDGTVYVGSFDSNLYALDGKTGAPKWQFATGDHIYSSPALGSDGTIYFASTDGNVYALDPAGNLLWRYDTGDVVRSSPVLGRAAGGAGEVVYVGAGNGTLFALDAATGKRRWSYDTTSRDPVLRDRNDLNASPALGPRGVYIGGEDGSVHYVPYDYCLHRSDARCNTDPGQAFPDELDRVFPVSSGGNLQQAGYTQTLPDSTTLIGRLVVRSGGTTADAQMHRRPMRGAWFGRIRRSASARRCRAMATTCSWCRTAFSRRTRSTRSRCRGRIPPEACASGRRRSGPPARARSATRSGSTRRPAAARCLFRSPRARARRRSGSSGSPRRYRRSCRA
ncbi:MAG: hypothetical protein QOC77_204 [Thermoleophilaceae bacterium]|nr:hypothetical protein [Thermoleophilaceae bacterium]